MILKLNTIRGRILSALLAVILFFVVSTSLSLLLVQKSERIREVKNEVTEIFINTLQLIEVDNNFFSTEISNQGFYMSGESRLVFEHDSLIASISCQLIDVESLPATESFAIGKDLEIADSLIRSYDKVYKDMILLVLKRGFKDYGLEGKMRKSAHALEEFQGEIDLVDLLTLRRKEKDFFLRHDTIYVSELNTLVDSLLDGIQRQESNLESRDRLFSLVSNYRNTFNEVVQVESQLGLYDPSGMGLKTQLSVLTSEIKDRFKTITSESKKNATDTIANFNVYYALSLIISLIVSLVISYALAYIFTTPIINLAEDVNAVIRSSFLKKLVIQKSPKYSKEVNELIDATDNMVDHIHHQLDTINSKSEALRKRNKLLVDSKNKLKELNDIKDKFFSIIAHDLRSPLATLTSFLSIFIKFSNTFTKEEATRVAKEMYQSVNSISALLENLLQWARSQMGRTEFSPTNVGIGELIQSNVDLLQFSAASKGVEISTDIQENFHVYADRDMIDFVLRNLISNAVKFTKSGGEVRVGIEVMENRIKVRVSDNGVGMSEQDQQKLFRTDVHLTKRGTADEKGTGLGLLLCKEFIEKNEGSIWVKSQEGEGTSFFFSLRTASENIEQLANT